MQVGAYLCPDINTFINIIQAISSTDENAIFGAYVIPSSMIQANSDPTHLLWDGQSTPCTTTKEFTKPSTLNGYTPKNNKLLTFPYCFMNVSNNNGSTNSLRYELFNLNANNKMEFLLKGVPVPRWIN